MVQNKAFAVILDDDYQNDEAALLLLKQDRFYSRCINFAIKCTQSTRHSTMFPPIPNYRDKMRNLKPYKEHFYCTSGYNQSPIPALATLLNKHTWRCSQEDKESSYYIICVFIILMDYELS